MWWLWKAKPSGSAAHNRVFRTTHAASKLPAKTLGAFCKHLTVEGGFICGFNVWWMTGFVHQRLLSWFPSTQPGEWVWIVGKSRACLRNWIWLLTFLHYLLWKRWEPWAGTIPSPGSDTELIKHPREMNHRTSLFVYSNCRWRCQAAPESSRLLLFQAPGAACTEPGCVHLAKFQLNALSWGSWFLARSKRLAAKPCKSSQLGFEGLCFPEQTLPQNKPKTFSLFHVHHNHPLMSILNAFPGKSWLLLAL